MTMLADLLDPSRVAKGLPTPKTPNALFSLVIDEVSLVHQGANEGAVVILKARLAVLKGEQALPVRKAADPAKVVEPVAKAGVMKAAAASLDELVAARRASHGGTKARLMTRC